jgi:signal transduction histidine kinase
MLRLVQDFNDEIRESCTRLLPDAKELREVGRSEAHKIRYNQWAILHDPLLFSLIGVAVPEQGTPKLYSIENNGQMSPLEWPANWERMRAEMTAHINGSGRPPNAPPDSNLIETPVFGDSVPSGFPELEWMIFELNPDHVRTKLLPDLVAEYLNPGSEAVYDVSVSLADAPGQVIFSTRGDGSSVASGADSTAGMFSADVGAPPRGAGRFRSGPPPSRWIIAARHRDGSLDAAVASARRRNLAASLILVGLLGGTAWALVQYTARSRRLAEMQFRFAAGVSHDLRTPLTAIRGAAFNVAEGLVKEPAAITRYAKMILRNAEELTAMIENVLAFSASLHSNTEERLATLAIGDLIQCAAAAMAQEIEQAGCRIEINVAPDLPAVAGDPVALELVFRNLVGNAVRHGAAGKWIGVSAARAGDGVEVRVCDRGPGVPDTERRRIFDPFYRGEEPRARRIQGTGLGLSLVRGTIERYKGSVEVANLPGGGAQFTVRLPVTAAQSL